jgi:four helix bundle protein
LGLARTARPFGAVGKSSMTGSMGLALCSTMEEPAGLTEWAKTQVPEAIRSDPIWRLPAYRYSLFLADQLRAAERQIRRACTRRTADQLLDAAQSISANIAEGYSRTGGPERAKFFEYANSSARETRDWLFKVRKALDPTMASALIELVTRIMKILTAVIPRERESTITRARLPQRAKPRPPDPPNQPVRDER